MSRRAPSWSAALLLALVILTTSPAAGQERAGEAELAEALQQLHLRSFARGRELLTSLLARPELDRQVEERARQQLERLQRRFTVHTQRIGLLAPLSGRYRQIGEAVVQGAELALQLDGGPTVVREDSQGTPEGAAAAVERLVLEQGVVALLGPVGDRECRAAALRAAELEVPIVLLGAATDLPALSPWAFRHRVTPEDQARAIAEHALFDLGLRSFAILYPDDPYGRTMMNAFWDAVNGGGGEVRGAESYPGRGREYTPAVRRLLGGYHAGARSEPFEIKGKGKQVAYQPYVDFEALFLPESPGRAREILSLVSFYDVRFRQADGSSPEQEGGGRTSHTPVQVLGPGSWNGPAIARGTEPVVQGAHLPGVLVHESPQPLVQAFLHSFRTRHRRQAGELEAQAYDAAGWLFVAWQRSAQRGRQAVQAALLQVGGFQGVGGTVRVLPDGGTRTALAILTVRGSTVAPLLLPGDRARSRSSSEPQAPPAIHMR